MELHHRYLISRSDETRFEHPEIDAPALGLAKSLHHFLRAEFDTELEAGTSWLNRLEQNLTGPQRVAHEDALFVESFNGKVFPERAWRQFAVERARPVVVVLPRIGVDGLIRAPVDPAV